jgi:hypothetical protein
VTLCCDSICDNLIKCCDFERLGISDNSVHSRGSTRPLTLEVAVLTSNVPEGISSPQYNKTFFCQSISSITYDQTRVLVGWQNRYKAQK